MERGGEARTAARERRARPFNDWEDKRLFDQHVRQTFVLRIDKTARAAAPGLWHTAKPLRAMPASDINRKRKLEAGASAPASKRARIATLPWAVPMDLDAPPAAAPVPERVDPDNKGAIEITSRCHRGVWLEKHKAAVATCSAELLAFEKGVRAYRERIQAWFLARGFPEGFLREEQLEAVARAVYLMVHRHGTPVNTSEMGAGKTRVFLAIAHIILSWDLGHVLVLAPKAGVARQTAKRYKDLFGDDNAVHFFDVAAAHRRAARETVAKSPSRLVIATYSQLDVKYGLKDAEFAAVILDEAHAAKRGTSKRTRLISSLRTLLYAMFTGTPATNLFANFLRLFAFVGMGAAMSPLRFPVVSPASHARTGRLLSLLKRARVAPTWRVAPPHSMPWEKTLTVFVAAQAFGSSEEAWVEAGSPYTALPPAVLEPGPVQHDIIHIGILWALGVAAVLPLDAPARLVLVVVEYEIYAEGAERYAAALTEKSHIAVVNRFSRDGVVGALPSEGIAIVSGRQADAACGARIGVAGVANLGDLPPHPGDCDAPFALAFSEPSELFPSPTATDGAFSSLAGQFSQTGGIGDARTPSVPIAAALAVAATRMPVEAPPVDTTRIVVRYQLDAFHRVLDGALAKQLSEAEGPPADNQFALAVNNMSGMGPSAALHTLRLLDGSDRPAVVFMSSRAGRQFLVAAALQLGIAAADVSGAPKTRRARLVREWASGERRVVVLGASDTEGMHLARGEEAVDVFLCDHLDFNDSTLQQAIARVIRAGQTGPVAVHRLARKAELAVALIHDAKRYLGHAVTSIGAPLSVETLDGAQAALGAMIATVAEAASARERGSTRGRLDNSTIQLVLRDPEKYQPDFVASVPGMGVERGVFVEGVRVADASSGDLDAYIDALACVGIDSYEAVMDNTERADAVAAAATKRKGDTLRAAWRSDAREAAAAAMAAAFDAVAFRAVAASAAPVGSSA